MNLGRRWYLVAWDCDREAWRTFRADRLARPSPAGHRFTPRKLPGGDPAAYVAANLSDAPVRHQARVRVHAPADEVGPVMGGTLVPVDERTCEFRAGDDRLDWLAMRVLMLGADFEVLEPPELADHLRGLAGRLARASLVDPSGSRAGRPAADSSSVARTQ